MKLEDGVLQSESVDTNTLEKMPHASDSGGECEDSICLDLKK